MNFDQALYKREQLHGLYFILLLMTYYIVLFSLAYFSEVRTDTCANPQGEGPCLMGSCPGDTVCINDNICCRANQVIPDPTIPPPTTPSPTSAAVITVSVTVAPTVATGATTAVSTACVDLVNPSTRVSDCPSRVYLCTNAVYYDLMTQQCPKTCGRCNSTTGSTCMDKVNPSTGVSDCTKMASYCTNSAYYTLMTEQCPKTCGRCSTTSSTTTSTATCVDKLNPSTGVSDCTRMASYCNNSAYYTLMSEQCPRTCGRCSSTSSSSITSLSSTTCVDKINSSTNVSDCPRMVSYCTVSSYMTLMRDQCPKTCGFCV